MGRASFTTRRAVSMMANGRITTCMDMDDCTIPITN